MAVDILGATESEHLIGEKLFNNYPKIKAALESIGLFRDSAANRITLYNNQSITDRLAKLPDNNSLVRALRSSGYGIVLHRGGITGT